MEYSNLSCIMSWALHRHLIVFLSLSTEQAQQIFLLVGEIKVAAQSMSNINSSARSNRVHGKCGFNFKRH